MLNYEMWLVNTKMTQPHHWSSRFNQWVVNSRGMGYWSGSKNIDLDIPGQPAAVCAPCTCEPVCILAPPHAAAVCEALCILAAPTPIYALCDLPLLPADVGMQRTVYLLGNPLVIWITSGAIVLWAIRAGVYLRSRGDGVASPAVRPLVVCRCVCRTCGFLR